MGERLLLDPGLATALRRAGVATAGDLLSLGGPPDARSLGRFVDLDVPGTCGRFYIKRYHYPGWRQSKGLVGRGTLWGRAPELNEFRALSWLRDHGLPGVRPVAAAARTRAGRLVAHGLLTEQVPAARSLHARLQDARDPLHARPNLRREVVATLAGHLARMHGLGFVHRDCHARNVLLREQPDGAHVWFLDCRRGGCGGRRRGPLFDLACLDADLRHYLSRTERRRGLAAYLDGGVDVRRVVRRVAVLRAEVEARAGRRVAATS